MKNLYAILGTHILTDQQTIEKILQFKISQNSLDNETIAQIRNYLLNPAVRQKYDQKLQQSYPNLLPQAQAIIEKSQQRKQIQTATKSIKPQSEIKKSALPKILLLFIVGFTLVGAGYWGYQQWKKPYTDLAINTLYRTDLTPAFKEQLLKAKKTSDNYQYQSVDFNEANGFLAINLDNQLQIWQNSNHPTTNVWQDAIENTPESKMQSQNGVRARWLPNKSILSIGNNSFWHLSPGNYKIDIEEKPSSPQAKLPIDTSFAEIASSEDGHYVLHAQLLGKSEMIIVNKYTQEYFVKTFQDNCCLVGWAKFSPNNQYLVTNVPSTNRKDVVDKAFQLQTNEKGDVIDLKPVATINRIDREKFAKTGKSITTDNLYFYQNILVTINDNGDLRYWDLQKDKLLSEVKLDYQPKQLWRAQFSTDGRYLWYPTKTEVHVFDLKTGKDHYISQNKASTGQNPTPIIIGNKNLWLQNTTPATSDILTANF